MSEIWAANDFRGMLIVVSWEMGKSGNCEGESNFWQSRDVMILVTIFWIGSKPIPCDLICVNNCWIGEEFVNGFFFHTLEFVFLNRARCCRCL